jgi:hypothetical protein
MLTAMFAFSITFKLLSWYLALKFGDTGRPSRPWFLGAAVAAVFAGFDILSEHRDLRSDVILSASYLVTALVILHIYYRVESVVWSVLIGAVGGGVLFLGVPYYIGQLLASD